MIFLIWALPADGGFGLYVSIFFTSPKGESKKDFHCNP